MSKELQPAPGNLPVHIDQSAALRMLQDMETAQPADMDLATDFWSPSLGDTLKCVFMGIETREMPDPNTGETKQLEVALLSTLDPVTGKACLKLHAGTQLLNTLREVAPPAPLFIQFVEEVPIAGSGGKKWKRFRVSPPAPKA
jgi:hypothetical protein